MGAFTIGQFIGGVFAVFVLYAIWEWALFKRILDDPMKGKLASVAAAYVTAGTLRGFGAANGGPFVPDGFVIYLFGAAVVSVYAWRRATWLKETSPDAETFS